MSGSILRRIYRVRPLSASIMCLPPLLIGFWYAWNAHERFHAARRIERDPIALSLETYQILLHDLLTRDLHRMTKATPPDPSRLEQLTFRMDQEDMDTLERGVERQSGRKYARAKLEFDGTSHKVELRLRGQRSWHLAAEQKSLKVQLDKGDLLKGHRVFNLINDPSPGVVGEHLILDLARENGLLAPQLGFARVRFNATDMGVFQYETQPDESLLRTNGRVPSSIYAGDLSADGDSWALWNSTEHWKKPAARTDDETTKQDFSELQRLLTKVRTASHSEFVDFVEHEVDLEKFALLDALDVAFGGDTHNFRQNQRYVFDPYRGRWEPIVRSFEGFRDGPDFNLVEYPLSMRLKMTPGYLARRNQLLYGLLAGEASFPSLERRGTKALLKLAPELRTDPFWDAYKLLNQVDAYHHRMLRPMTMRRATLALRADLVTYRRRVQQLRSALEKNPLFLRWRASVEPVSAGPGRQASEHGPPPAVRHHTLLELFIDGQSGASVDRIRVRLGNDCADQSARLSRQGETLSEATLPTDLELDGLVLQPAVAVASRPKSSGAEGNIRTQLLPERYELSLETACPPLSVDVHAVHLVTGSRILAQPVEDNILARLPRSRSSATDAIRFAPGEVAPHAWSLERPHPSQVTLGPGTVEIAQTRVFEAHQRVKVLPGTQLKLGAKASLIFLGPTEFQGTRTAPITVERAGTAPWGGIALQGRYTQGSRLRHVSASGGSTPSWRLVSYPAMINVHDTKDIAFEHCHFKDNTGSGDVVHVAYVDNVAIADSKVSNAASDAWDLEFVRGKMLRLSAVNIGDDALDLMGAKVDVQDSVLVGIKGNAISAGEESKVDLRNSVISEATVGVLAKNASDVDLDGVLLFRNETGVRVYQRTVRYAGSSSVTADSLFCVDTKKKIVKRDDRGKSELDYGQARSGFPPAGSLDMMLRDLMGLRDWAALAVWSQAQRDGSVL